MSPTKPKSSKSALKLPTDFKDQMILDFSEEETYNFGNAEITALRKTRFFPEGAVFRPFDPKTKADLMSSKWVYFLSYPFSIGMTYPFSDLVTDFFEITGLAYSQVMPMMWRFLYTIDRLNDIHETQIGLPEICSFYKLWTHGNHRYVFKVRTRSDCLLEKMKNNDGDRKRGFFFVRRDSIGGEDLPEKWVRECNRKIRF